MEPFERAGCHILLLLQASIWRLLQLAFLMLPLAIYWPAEAPFDQMKDMIALNSQTETRMT